MTTLLLALATGLYSGYLPRAPGTWGSLVGLLVFLPLSTLALPAYLTVLLALAVIGFFAAGAAEKIMDRPDPGPVVIDEIVGMLITMTGSPRGLLPLVLGFLLFRLFDIYKPFPIRQIDRRLHGGLGIMLDDVVAGLYSLLVLHGLLWALG